MRKWLLLFWFLVCFGGAPVEAQDTSLAGVYVVEGDNDDGSTYKLRAEVLETDGIISIQLLDEAGQEAGRAVGLREGNVISTIFQVSSGVVGVAVYRLEGDRWIGKWYVPGAPSTLKEVLTKVDPKLHGAEFGPKREL